MEEMSEPGERIAVARGMSTVPFWLWGLLSLICVVAGIPIMLASVSLLNAAQRNQVYGGQVALGVGAILVIISAACLYSGLTQQAVHRIHFHRNGLIAFQGRHRRRHDYSDVASLSVRLAMPGRWWSTQGLKHALLLLFGFTLMTIRSTGAITDSSDYLFGGGEVTVRFRDGKEQFFHVRRFRDLKQLAEIIESCPNGSVQRTDS